MVANYLNKFSRKSLIITLIIASVVGLIAAGYTASAKIFPGDQLSVCSISESFDCDVVNQSKWSEIAGIPVSFMGFGAYALFLIGGTYLWQKKDETIITLLGALAIIGMAFSLYLTAIEAFVLKTWCLFCIAQQIAIIFVFASVFAIRHKDSK